MPAEDPAFPPKVRIASYPTREYLGFVFAYLGEGEPPEFPRYPEFEDFDGVLELDSYTRRCNYYQNLENALDMSHVGFGHHDNEASFAGIGSGETLRADESPWGVTYTATRASGETRANQFGMPNIFHINALPTDPEIGWHESLFWWVPIDDEQHVQFSLHRFPLSGDAAERYRERRLARRARLDLPHAELAERICAGELRLADVDLRRTDVVRLQDDVAQVGQGRIADRAAERLAGVLPDLHAVVLNPAGPGKDLRVLPLADGDDRAGAVEDDAPGARRALVDRGDVLRHEALPRGRSRRAPASGSTSGLRPGGWMSPRP
jgi:5,5'-dehydrodivanillate O-demethylase